MEDDTMNIQEYSECKNKKGREKDMQNWKLDEMERGMG